MRRLLRFLAPIVVLTLLSVFSWAQNAATSELHVTVRDPKGAVVTNATVAARDEGTLHTIGFDRELKDTAGRAVQGREAEHEAQRRDA